MSQHTTFNYVSNKTQGHKIYVFFKIFAGFNIYFVNQVDISFSDVTANILRIVFDSVVALLIFSVFYFKTKLLPRLVHLHIYTLGIGSKVLTKNKNKKK